MDSERLFPKPLYDNLVNDLIGISEAWLLWEQLHYLTEEELDLLDWAGYGFFLTVRRGLFQTVVIGIGRLLDKTRGTNSVHKFYLELIRLSKTIKTTWSDSEIRKDYSVLEDMSSPILDIRNNAIAHAGNELLIKPVEYAHIEKCLHQYWKFLDKARNNFTGVSLQGMEHLKIPGDVLAVVDLLKQNPSWPAKLASLKNLEDWYQ
jgi:hypothetical protein